MFGLICLAANFMTFFIFALGAYLRPRLFQRCPFYCVWVPLVFGFALLQGMVITGASILVLIILSGISIGLGSACGLICWEQVFSENAAIGIRRVILSSTALTAVPYYLITLVTPQDYLIPVLTFVLVPLCLVLLYLAGRGGDTPPLVDLAPSRNRAAYKKVLSRLWVPMLCALSFGLVSPIVDIVALRGAPSYSLTMILIQISGVFVAGILWFLWNHLHQYPSIVRVCMLILPVFAVLLFFFPFVGTGYSYAVLFVAAGCYVIVSILMMVTCIDEAENARVSLVVVYGLFAGILYVSRMLGEVVARAFVANSYDQSVQVIASAVFLVYVVSMVAYLAYRALNKGATYAQEGNAPDDGAGDGVLPTRAMLNKILGARCDALAKTHSLSEREREVLEFLARGYTVPGIADELFLSRNTVRTHTKRLYAALGVHTRQELIRMVEDAPVD